MPGAKTGGIALTAGLEHGSSAPARGLALRVFAPFALGYFLSYVYRTVNSVIGPNLAADVGLSAAQLGLLTSAYFFAFALFQLPLGMLLDRYGPRRVQVGLLSVAAAGTALFAVAQQPASLAAARALIGLGVSGCMMASFKAFVQWFPPRRLPMMNAWLLAVGGTGALAATLPVELFLQWAGWRELFWGLAGFAAVVALVVGAVVPEHPEPPAHVSLSAQLRGLARVLSDGYFWSLAPITMLTQGTYLAFQGLWAGPWLRDVAGLGRGEVAVGLFVLAGAVVAGFALSGTVAERLGRRGVRPLTVAVVGMSAFAAVELLMVLLPGARALWLLPLFGLLAAAGTLCYAILSQAFPRQVAGRVNTALNLLVFVAAFLLQWGMGAILSLWEDPVTKRYQAEGYDWALGLVVAMQVLALLWFYKSKRAE